MPSSLNRNWRAEALVALPRFFDTPSGSLPDLLQFRSAVPAPIQAVRGVLKFVLAPMPDHPYGGLVAPSEIVSIQTAIEAVAAEDALAAVAAPLEEFVDFLALQLQRSIPVVSLEILDLTPPVVAGDIREGLLFPAPGGYLFPKAQSSQYMGGVHVTTAPQLDLPPSWSATRARAARDWYLKGLAATADADRFMLFWVSMEVIFNGSGVKVVGTPECSNGHPQAEMDCPECGKPYLRMVRGDSIQQFLTETCGVSIGDAHLLWRMRQMFHGEVSFDSPKLWTSLV